MLNNDVVIKTIHQDQVTVHYKNFKNDDERKELLQGLSRYFFDKWMHLSAMYGDSFNLAKEAKIHGEECKRLLKNMDDEYERELIDDKELNYYIQQAVYYGMNPEV